MRDFLFAIGFTSFGYLLRGLMIVAKNEYLREDDIEDEEDNDDNTDETDVSKEDKEE